MKKTLVLALSLLLHILSKAQSTSSLISRIDYNCNSSLIPNRANGTIKYEYDSRNRLIGINLLNKANLNDVHQIKFEYKPNQIGVVENGWSQPIKTDERGRINEISYKSNSNNQILPLKLQLAYTDGYLSRVNAYNFNKISIVYQLSYIDGNLVKLAPTFAGEDTGYPHTYTIKYSDQLAPANFNLGLGLYIAVLYNRIGQIPIYLANNFLLGNQSKNLIAQILDTQEGETGFTYHFDYQSDSKGRVSKIILAFFNKNSGYDNENTSTFTLTYKD